VRTDYDVFGTGIMRMFIYFFSPSGAKIFSRTTCIAVEPPRCKESAPIIEKRVCASTVSIPEFLRLSD